jgi:hypothetical protein
MNFVILPIYSSWVNAPCCLEALNKTGFRGVSKFRFRYQFAKVFSELSNPAASRQTIESSFFLLKIRPAHYVIATLEDLLEKLGRVLIWGEDFAAVIESGEIEGLLSHLQDLDN